MAKKFKIVELYAGTGRSVQPFLKWKRADKPLLVDINHYAAEVYKYNHPDSHYFVSDLSKITPKSLGNVDILLGCPPCQGYSDNGQRLPNDPRNIHVAVFSRFINELRPLAVGMENVPLLAESSRFEKFIGNVEAAGYFWTASIANAALWGSCQSRQRLMFVAIRKDVGVEPKLPVPTHGGQKLYYSYRYRKMCRIEDDLVGMLGRTPGTLRANRTLPHNIDGTLGSKPIPTVSDIISDLPRANSPEALEMNHIAWAHTGGILKRMKNVLEGGRWKGGKDHFSQAYGRLHRKGISRTITTYLANPGSGRYWHPTENRALTLREAARIQGFPDSFHFLSKNSENCVLVGNALDAALAKITYNTIRKSLE